LRKFLGTVVVLLLITAAVGYCRGWFGIPSGGSSSDGKQVNVNMPVDRDKIADDAAAAKAKAGEIADKIKDRVKDQKSDAPDR
jgi:hypothetical protein